MRATRAHAPTLSAAAAIAELERCAGRQFDPQVVIVLARVVNQLSTASLPTASVTP